ncbi:gamma-carotene 1'-hydroxylase CruF [Calothrix sp. NIES-3974]|uniref:gamma-carotene 1'-hydroxylase CruF n=1 Tax=Calothrix sp. NIES-3974 TaxID=2005462 RepID=UPI000B5EB835|nr:carotenoid biosynthesis protein [Calothrix sp. NIES-3974]BAZ06154.1 hypothetical protein NIES3974_28110 [Calothrix sp. NIES-3974]
MRQVVIVERVCLTGHILAKVFGLVGILIVIPNANFVLNWGDVGEKAMHLSLTDGGVVDIVLGTIAVSIFAFRTLGLTRWLSFMLPAIFISVGSELLGTSTGFPFGDYSYLSGLGYKIAGLVPFTIPLSWFYVGISAYLIARAGLSVSQNPTWKRQIGAVVVGAILFTCWDFALEPAMSQTIMPFWAWATPGAFYGTPYQNYLGWFGTSALFMGVAAILWRNAQIQLKRSHLTVPIIVYLSNFAFAAGLSLGAGFFVPVALGCVFGVIPATSLWWKAIHNDALNTTETLNNQVAIASVKVAVE